MKVCVLLTVLLTSCAKHRSSSNEVSIVLPPPLTDTRKIDTGNPGNPIPELNTLYLVGSGLVLVFFSRRREKK